MDYKKSLKLHLGITWKSEPLEIEFDSSTPIGAIKDNFLVLEYPPYNGRKLWCYTTCGMSSDLRGNSIEVHIFSKEKDLNMPNLLAMVAHYHLTVKNINLWHTVNFGMSWKQASECTFGLISLPYLDGPDIENFIYENKSFKLFWLIPITKQEVEFKKKRGIESLEELFEKHNFDYANPRRKSTVSSWRIF